MSLYQPFICYLCVASCPLSMRECGLCKVSSTRPHVTNTDPSCPRYSAILRLSHLERLSPRQAAFLNIKTGDQYKLRNFLLSSWCGCWCVPVAHYSDYSEVSEHDGAMLIKSAGVNSPSVAFPLFSTCCAMQGNQGCSCHLVLYAAIIPLTCGALLALLFWSIVSG